ncbi:Protein CBG08077 [Caenorhabditis briggsae]|uniref:Protein CBG08077 n=1 Tax=Caenorhabditis briggsae TaxID=6238 RepID=A8X5R2_CAEBR|nr:Protein CBG08077 [Caenorhabditis briggsae]CAP27973.2 Protein CBG08077 [Caenorhabditis briggsae]
MPAVMKTIQNFTPRCGSQLISIELNFDPTQLPGGKFTDWIIVGVSGKFFPLQPAQNVFQNRIRIGKNPVVILEKDQSITVKCVYGLPTIETMTLPVINSNFNVDNFAFSNHSEQFSTNSPSEANFNINESSNRHQLLENRESLDAYKKSRK